MIERNIKLVVEIKAPDDWYAFKELIGGWELSLSREMFSKLTAGLFKHGSASEAGKVRLFVELFPNMPEVLASYCESFLEVAK